MNSSQVMHPLFATPMPAGWRLTKTDDIKAEEKSACVAGPFGSNISSKYFVESGVPIIRGGNLTDDLTRFVSREFVFVSADDAKRFGPQHVRGGDLVFTCWGTVGQVGLIPSDGPYREYIISNKQLKLRPNLRIADPEYLFFYFACPQMVSHIRGKAIGAAVPGINLGILKELPVALPPLPEQRRIGSILSAYDDLIENCQRRIRILEDMARGVYREWFVHFRFPGADAVLRVDSPLGPIPQGWAAQKLGDVLQLNYGKALKKEVRRDGTVPVFGSSGVVGQHDESLAPGPGIVVGRKGNVGSVFWCDEAFFVIDTAYYVTATLPLRFLFYDLQTKNFINNDSAVPGLSRHQAYALDTLVPPTELLAKFCRLADGFEAQAAIHRRKITNLRRTRDLLLPRLLSGQIALRAETGRSPETDEAALTP